MLACRPGSGPPASRSLFAGFSCDAEPAAQRSPRGARARAGIAPGAFLTGHFGMNFRILTNDVQPPFGSSSCWACCCRAPVRSVAIPHPQARAVPRACPSVGRASFKLTPLHDASWRQPRPADGRDRAGIGASESTVGLRKRSTRSDPLDLNRVSSRLPERVNNRMLTLRALLACVAAQEPRFCRQFWMGRAGIEPATLGLRVEPSGLSAPGSSSRELFVEPITSDRMAWSRAALLTFG